MVKVSSAVAAVLVLSQTSSALVEGPWSNVNDTPDVRAKALVDAMTLDEKLAMLHGPADGPCCSCKTNASCAYVGNIAANTRLQIPPVNMNDGPQGFRDNNHPDTSTAWPSGLTMAASWDRAALGEWGTGMGKEFYAKGANVQLGPGLCLARVPRNGRNFEYLSGEDPFLGATLVQPVIKGIQSQKVVANAKHYVLNNQETNRNAVIADIDERTRFEMYYPVFKGASDAGVGSVMCSYNKIADHGSGGSSEGQWSCENPITLAHDLKVKTGFKGYVMSDWGATHSTSLMAGLDVEMPSAQFMGPDAINAGLADGSITKPAVDDSVFRILRAMFDVGVMDEPIEAWDWKKQEKNVTTAASVASVRRLSAAATVLLKNDQQTLPLPQGAKIAVLGFGDVGTITHGGGSGAVTSSYIATPLTGITAAAGAHAKVTFNDGTDISAAAAAAAAADYAVVFVGTLSHEGGDRASLSLDDGCDPSGGNIGKQCQGNHANQNALIAAVAKANKKTVVVAAVPGAVLMPWSGDVAAILTNFLPGQQAGNAIADVLFGAVNPSAKLPLTFPNAENETALTPAQWPGLPDPNSPVYANYTEGLLVGYRYYDAHNISFSTGFPFGHGLSYTSFAYSNLAVAADGKSVTADIKNTGAVAGAEVAQMYLGFPRSAGEPPKVLRGFEKVALAAGETKTATFPLDAQSTSIWDASAHDWAQVHGDFTVLVGSSSRDIRLTKAWTA
jgi:beta-glucosidase